MVFKHLLSKINVFFYLLIFFQHTGFIIICDRGSIPTLGVYSTVIPLVKGLIVHYLVFPDGSSNRRSRVCANITLHTRKIPSHSLKKTWPLWPVMTDDNAPTHEKRKFVKTYKNVLLQKQTVVAKVSGETYS